MFVVQDNFNLWRRLRNTDRKEITGRHIGVSP